jgi:1,4-alpha-glucan branching enzyme
MRRSTRAWTWALAVMAVASLACAARWEGARLAPGGVVFQLRRPDAASVAIAGDFNGWSTSSHPMMRAGDRWTAVVALPPGEHLFMYVIDGDTWIEPPSVADRVPDGFGGWNGRVVVP